MYQVTALISAAGTITSESAATTPPASSEVTHLFVVANSQIGRVRCDGIADTRPDIHGLR